MKKNILDVIEDSPVYCRYVRFASVGCILFMAFMSEIECLRWVLGIAAAFYFTYLIFEKEKITCEVKEEHKQ